MSDYEFMFERELHDKLSECQARQARLQNLEWEIRAELTQLEQDEEQIQKTLARLLEAKSLNPCSTSFQIALDEVYFEYEEV